jgi:hypothetical protein
MNRIYFKNRTTGVVGTSSAKLNDRGCVVYTWVNGVFHMAEAFYKLYYLVDYHVYHGYQFN